MFSPILGGKQNRSNEEVTEWERRRSKFSEDYDGSPWLTSLVTFSGFVAAFIGSVVVLFVIANLRHGTVWLPYALILGALVGAHLCLRAVRYQRRRHARRLPVDDHGQITGDRRREDQLSEH
jgi:Flp pilus assembly protein TadB